MPARRPLHSCCLPHCSVTSSPHASSKHLEHSLRRISTILTGLTPGYLSSATSLLATSACIDSKGTMLLATQFVSVEIDDDDDDADDG